jgi:hypothetical protein
MKYILVVTIAVLLISCGQKPNNEPKEVKQEETKKTKKVNLPKSVTASVSYPGFPVDKLVDISKTGTIDWLVVTQEGDKIISFAQKKDVNYITNVDRDLGGDNEPSSGFLCIPGYLNGADRFNGTAASFSAGFNGWGSKIKDCNITVNVEVNNKVKFIYLCGASAMSDCLITVYNHLGETVTEIEAKAEASDNSTKQTAWITKLEVNAPLENTPLKIVMSIKLGKEKEIATLAFGSIMLTNTDHGMQYIEGDTINGPKNN